MNEQVEKIMKNLGVSREEAIAIYQSDKAIDRGEDLFPLTDKQKKVEKEMRQADHKKPTIYKFDQSKSRKKAENTEKASIIAGIFSFLENFGVENAEMLNKERQIAFSIGENKYELTLVQKRKPKS